MKERKHNSTGGKNLQAFKKRSRCENSKLNRNKNEIDQPPPLKRKVGKGRNKSAPKSLYLYGVLPVEAALIHRRRKIDHLYLKKAADSSKRLRKIRLLGEQYGIPVSEISVKKLEEMCPDALHQGVVISCESLPYSSFSDLPQTVEGKYNLIVALDQIADPHNLGAILRTCGFFKVSAVVLPQDHSTGLTAVVAKASAGVSEWFPVISVPNLARFIQQQKSNGFWVVGLVEDAVENVSELSQDRPIILVLGNEGKGIR
ncbi:MAG: RNA methyltransferase, partial [SAR324 cluster bacterium]|nr:RNA methyltransferase [SAR324 cluster bacterium]